MPYTGDHIQKEKEALDLMIKMRKGAQNENRSAGLVVFVLFPLVCAVAVLKSNDIKDFAAHNHQISQIIRLAYPSWKEAAPAKSTVQPVAGAEGTAEQTGSDSSQPAVTNSGQMDPNSASPVQSPAGDNQPAAAEQEQPAGTASNSSLPAGTGR